jgi:glutamyl-tRNA synthetase
MSREELVARFDLSRVQPSPATFDYEKLNWMNGVYLRAMDPDDYAHALVIYLGEQGYDWDAELVHKAGPIVQEKIEKFSDFPAFAGFLFQDVSLDGHELDADVLAEAERTLGAVEPFTAETIEQALRSLADRLGLKPRDAFQPIRIAVTGSKVSPGLFESLELLGKQKSIARLSAARSGTA